MHTTDCFKPSWARIENKIKVNELRYLRVVQKIVKKDEKIKKKGKRVVSWNASYDLSVMSKYKKKKEKIIGSKPK